MRIHAAFQGKQLAMEDEPCEVRKVISLPDKEYAFFKKHLMYEYDFLRKNKDQMGFHNGIRQCAMVMGESSEDGVLVDSSGYDYARYTAPFLGARSYMTLREQNLQANGKLKTLTADDLVILHAKHTLWVYGVGGEQADFSHCRIAGLNLGDMQFNGALFLNAVLEDVDFGNAGVCGADLRNCCVENLSLEDTELEDAYTQGIAEKEQDWERSCGPCMTMG